MSEDITDLSRATGAQYPSISIYSVHLSGSQMCFMPVWLQCSCGLRQSSCLRCLQICVNSTWEYSWNAEFYFCWGLVMRLHSYPDSQALMRRLDFVSFFLNPESVHICISRSSNIFINGLLNDLMSWHILQAGEPNSYPSSHLLGEICPSTTVVPHLTWLI